MLEDSVYRQAAEAKIMKLERDLLQARKLQALGLLASGMAHDFNNVLSAISGYAELLKRKFGENELDIARYSEVILSSCMRAAEMVERLKLFTRKDRKSEMLVDVHPLLEELKDLLVFMLPQRYKVSWDLGAVSHWLAADPGLFQGSILHLLILGRSVLPKGGNLTLRTSNISAKIAGAAVQPVLVLDLVSNDEKLDQTALEQAVSSSTAGLVESSGLNVVREYVASLGGALEVERLGSTGIRLRMMFPLTILRDPESIVEEENAIFLHDENSEARSIAVEKLRTVLVIDDEPEIRAFLMEMCRAWGLRGVSLEDADSVAQWVNSGEDFYAAMVDHQLGSDDGSTLCEWLQSQYPQARLALMTGLVGDMNSRVLQTRKIALFEKPFDVPRIKAWLCP